MPAPPNINVNTNKRLKSESLSADELVSFMKKHGISDQELATIFGVTVQAVRLWTSGRRGFSITNSRIVRLFMRYPTLIREF